MEFFKFPWKTGFITFINFFHMTMMRAVIVLPIFLFSRIFRKNKCLRVFLPLIFSKNQTI
ncbi:DUF6460 domain-containing protein [Bartonella sp. MR168JLCBS]|uniref:DUF6460 domain-containing protein n=1 Tax=Bartonella sp. MR168JLCBS TaxID=3243556 RepID=UPI0035D03156